MSKKIYNIIVDEDYYFDVLSNNDNFSGALYTGGDTFVHIGDEECIRVGSIINQKNNEYRIDVFIPMSIWEKVRHLVYKTDM